MESRGKDGKRALPTIMNLKGADLRGVNLKRADLGRANLRGAKGLTLEQLSKVKTLYRAELDQELEKHIKEKNPHLLEKPKEG